MRDRHLSLSNDCRAAIISGSIMRDIVLVAIVVQQISKVWPNVGVYDPGMDEQQSFLDKSKANWHNLARCCL